MSIAPVQSLSSSGREPFDRPSVPSGKKSSRAASDAPASAGQAASDSKAGLKIVAATSTYELPSDVVELHEDPDLKGQVVIQYLDQSKNVILQVPSAQELDFERGIAQEFDKAAKVQQSERAAATAAAREGDTTHGD